LENVVKGILKSANMQTNGNFADVIRAMSGLSIPEAENAAALSLIETGKLDVEIINREKIQAIKKTGTLEFIPPDPRGLDAIGGFKGIKKWILLRKKAFTDAARTFGCSIPKGVFLVGVAGCGKSLFAKIIGIVFGMPVVRADVGRMKGQYVGETGRNIRAALAMAEAVAPCALWLDEVDKVFAGVGSGGKLDAGVSDDLFGTVLTWMQEKTAPVFVIMTANDVTNLPAPLMRAGRIDAVFSVDLPVASERLEIFQIHLKKRNRAALADALKIDSALINATDNFTGSEIEVMVESGLFRAFDAERELTENDMLEAAREFVPLIVTQREQIEQMRAWAKTRAMPASGIDATGGWQAADATDTGRRMFTAPEK